MDIGDVKYGVYIMQSSSCLNLFRAGAAGIKGGRDGAMGRLKNANAKGAVEWCRGKDWKFLIVFPFDGLIIDSEKGKIDLVARAEKVLFGGLCYIATHRKFKKTNDKGNPVNILGDSGFSSKSPDGMVRSNAQRFGVSTFHSNSTEGKLITLPAPRPRAHAGSEP